MPNEPGTTLINSNKLLKGVRGIAEHYGLTEHLVRKFLQMGLPASLVDDRWYAWSDNTDIFFIKMTSKQNEFEIPENGNGLSKKGT